jgi:hypothetical protein
MLPGDQHEPDPSGKPRLGGAKNLPQPPANSIAHDRAADLSRSDEARARGCAFGQIREHAQDNVSAMERSAFPTKLLEFGRTRETRRSGKAQPDIHCLGLGKMVETEREAFR